MSSAKKLWCPIKMSIKFRTCYRHIYLSRHIVFSSQRHLTSSTTAKSIVFEHLPNRSMLKLSGLDTSKFLQGVITNDMDTFNQNDSQKSCIYSLILNTTGQVLYDCLLYRMGEDNYLLEHDTAATKYLKLHLQKYRLRKVVQVEPVEYSIWVAYSWANDAQDIEQVSSEDLSSLEGKEGLFMVEDPRMCKLGHRIIINKGSTAETQIRDIAMANVNKGATYDILRYKFGIGEGVVDHPPGRCLPFETNFDILKGVSFNKGCYIGQETTARIQFTGVVRKRLMPVILSPEQDTYPVFDAECAILNDKGSKIGKFRNNFGKWGLAVLNVVDAMKSNVLTLKGYDYQLIPSRPTWWPSETIAN